MVGGHKKTVSDDQERTHPRKSTASFVGVSIHRLCAGLRCGCGGGEVASWWVWQRLEPETDRANDGFRTFLSLPSSDRTLVAAYRSYVGNPNASKVSDAWNEWARRYAWKERARALDAHIDPVRRDAMEKAVEEQAAEQARQAERTRTT